MNTLRNYLNSMPKADQERFASDSRTSLGYLRKAISTKQRLGLELVARLHKNSGGYVLATDLRPDVNWGDFSLLSSSPPADSDLIASGAIKAISSQQNTQLLTGGCLYSASEQERRAEDRREEERRDHERRAGDRREAS